MIRRILTFIPPIALLSLYIYRGVTQGFNTMGPKWLILIGLLFAAAIMLAVFRRVGLIVAIGVAVLIAVVGFTQATEIIGYIIGGIGAVIYAAISFFGRKRIDK